MVAASPQWWALAATALLGFNFAARHACAEEAGSITVVPRAQVVYSASPRLRIFVEGSSFSPLLASKLAFKFMPPVDPETYTVQVLSSTVLSLNLNPGHKWLDPTNLDGMTLYLTELKIGASQLLPQPVPVAQVIPTPTVQKAPNYVVYMTGSGRLVINGTNFRDKYLSLTFDPPLERNQDYILSVRSPTMAVLTRTFTSSWRPEPGPLRVRSIDTGGGAIRLNLASGGVLVAEVQANLGAHGVSVRSTPDVSIYQTTSELTINGDGFSPDSNILRFANGILGRGVNYTTVSQSTTQLSLKLMPGSRWRANGANLPAPLILLAVDAGAGFVPMGPTEAKKGRTVATVFETPAVKQSSEHIFRTHTHELWIRGTGFTTSPYNTQVFFHPALQNNEDVSITAVNRTHLRVLLLVGKAWADGPGSLTVVAMDTGAGPVHFNGGIQVAVVDADDRGHVSGAFVERSTQVLYQTAAIRKLIMEGDGFLPNTVFVFDPPLEENVHYVKSYVSESKVILSLKKHQKWRSEGGALLCTALIMAKGFQGTGKVPIGSGGRGIQVATILDDPIVLPAERVIFASHTKRLIVLGAGFSPEGTELALFPTPRSAYEVETITNSEIILRLNDGEAWATVQKGRSAVITVSKVDTGAGEVIFEEPVVIARVESDADDNHCDDSCEFAVDGVCDDGSQPQRSWFDDDYGGFYYTQGSDDTLPGFYYYDDGLSDPGVAPVCARGTDCTDCGGPVHPTEAVNCDNSCRWANDGTCDDHRASGLCLSGTDCHDCGPVDATNFTGEADSWLFEGQDDPESEYWMLDDEEPGVIKKRKREVLQISYGFLFIRSLEIMVYICGFVFCSFFAFVMVRFAQGSNVSELTRPIEAVFSQAAAESRAKRKSRAPITPDVHFT